MMMMLAMTASAESDSSRINRQRKAIGRQLIKVQSTNWPAVLQYYTDDIEYHDPIVDIEGFRVYYRCAVDPTFDCPLDQGESDDTFDEVLATMENSPVATPYKLQQNVPNPFNPSTSVSFEMPDGGGQVALRIYDVSGRLVRTLIDGFESAGTRKVEWNGQDDQGQSMASGIYYYQMTGPAFSEKKKMVLLR